MIQDDMIRKIRKAQSYVPSSYSAEMVLEPAARKVWQQRNVASGVLPLADVIQP